MSLKELTWKYHQDAERTSHARKLLTGMTPIEYHKYLCNQYKIYYTLEVVAEVHGVLDGIEDIIRSDKILADVIELESEYPFLSLVDDSFGKVICSATDEYTTYISKLTNRDRLLAHIYVRHFGDMYGGQMIAKRNPGSGTMYEFENVEQLKTTVRARLSDDMADEANVCFQFAIKLFKELSDE